jgi:PKD repeat protein
MKIIAVGIFLIALSCLIHPQYLSAQDPEAIANLEFWLRSNEEISISADKVETWGSLNNDLVATNDLANRRPTLVADLFTEQPGVFIGGDQTGPFLNIAPLNTGASYTIYALIKTEGFNNPVQYLIGLTPGNRGFGFTNSNQRFVYVDGGIQAQTSQGLEPNSFYFIQMKYDASVDLMNFDINFGEISVEATIPDQVPVETVKIGTRSDQNWSFNGSIAEVLYYSDAHTSEESGQIEQYILDYYAPPLNLPSEIVLSSYCDTILSIPDRYSSISWSNGSDSSTTTITSDGLIDVTATTIFGEVLSASVNVKYPGVVLESFELCSGTDSIWNPQLDGFEIEWQDGSTDVTFLISEVGFYSFSATDLDGCSFNSESIEITIDDFPSQESLPSFISLCEGESLESSLESNEGLIYLWDTGSNEPSIVVENTQVYSLVVTNSNGCVNEAATDVIITGISPAPAFEFTRDCITDVLSFNDLSIPAGSSEIVSWNWNFDDGTTSNAQNVSHTFETPGAYNVILEVLSSEDCLAAIDSLILISSEIMLGEVIENGCANYETVITDASSISFDTIESIEWEITNSSEIIVFSGDGTEISNTFNEEGLYQVLRVFEKSSGCSDTLSSIIEIKPSSFCFLPNELPDLSFWLDADSLVELHAAINQVNIWGNRFDDSHDAVAPDLSNSPLYVENIPELNYHSTLRFDGVNDWMDFSQLNNIRTIVMMYKHRTGTQTGLATILGHPLLNNLVGGANDLLLLPTAINPFVANGITAVNGNELLASTLVKPLEYSIFSIAPSDTLVLQYITNDRNTAGRYWDGDYSEILFFNDFLSPEEQNQVEQYLRYKYAPPIDLPRQIRVEYGFCDTALVGYQPWFRTYDWSTGSQDSTIQVNESGWYNLTVTDLFGYTSTDSVEVIFDGTFGQESETLCALETLTYSTGLDSDEYSLDWSTDETSSSIDITEEGFYSVTIDDTLGCSYASPNIFIDVDSFPITANLIDIPTFCLGNDLFLSSGFAEAETYLWNTDEVSPFIQPQVSDEYWVEAINVNGCIGRDTVDIDIAGVAPDAEFEVSPPCENNEVIFDDITVPDGGTVVEWSWVFGDALSGFGSAAFGSAQAPGFANQYTATGQYPVTLTVTLDNGCTGTTRDTILVNPLPLVNFSAPLVCAGNEVFFESLSVVPGNGTIAQRDWSFGNGTTDMGSIGSTTFETLGFNTVTHIVTTEDACVDSLVRTVEVLGSPIVDFDVTDVCIGQSVVFNENVDTSVSGPIFYNWQFGDGFFSNFPNTSHEYAQAGVYEVTLTATGNNVGVNGCVDQETREIRVYEPPLANSTTTDACIGAAVNLVDVSLWRVIEGTTDPVISRQWNILDGPTGNQEGFIGMDSVQTFIPAAAGTFDVGLELETAAGCQASSTGSFLVQAIPSADFDLTLPEINPPFTSVPDNLSEDGINFEWLINGELVSTEFEPSLTFDSAGDYEVVLVATNDLNCNDSAMAMFTVILPEYDIALIELQYQTQGTTLVLNAIISNNGNVVVETFDTEIEVGRDIQFTVVSDFTLLPGVLVDYPLGSDIGYIPGRDLPYTCMRISNPNGQTETDTTNNYLCIGLNEQRATFGDPYPNPAKDEVKLTFVLPDDGPLSVEITGSDGRLMESFVLDLKEGLNTVDYPLIGWSEGMYFLKFSYRNQEEVFRLVVAR